MGTPRRRLAMLDGRPVGQQEEASAEPTWVEMTTLLGLIARMCQQWMVLGDGRVIAR